MQFAVCKHVFTMYIDRLLLKIKYKMQEFISLQLYFDLYLASLKDTASVGFAIYKYTEKKLTNNKFKSVGKETRRNLS